MRLVEIGVTKSDIHKVITTMIAICLQGWLKKERFLPDGLKNAAIGEQISTATTKELQVIAINPEFKVVSILGLEFISHFRSFRIIQDCRPAFGRV